MEFVQHFWKYLKLMMNYKPKCVPVLICFANLFSDKKMVSATPSNPVYYLYKFQDNVDSVLIRALSDDKKCAILSIQDIKVSTNVFFSFFPPKCICQRSDFWRLILQLLLWNHSFSYTRSYMVLLQTFSLTICAKLCISL